MKLLALLILASAAPQEKPKPAELQVAVHSFQTLRDDRGRQLVSDWQAWAMDLENRLGRDADLTIRVADEGGQVLVTRRETMSRGARKRLFFHLPSGAAGRYGGSQPTYEIRDSSGAKLTRQASEPRGALEPNAWQVGLFSGDKSSSSAFGLPQVMGTPEVAVARLTPSTFPERWPALACLDALLLHDAPLDELTLDQAQALADYARAGGTVILSPGPDAAWLAHKVLKAFVTIRTGPPVPRTDLEALTSGKAFGPFSRNERFLFHPIEGGRELDWKREALLFDAGFGRVIVLPFDIRRPPFDSWGGMERFWAALLGHKQVPRRFGSELPETLPGATSEARLGLFQSIAMLINPYPSWFLLVALAVLFLAAVGPVNYMVLRRMGMTLLIVITVPAISFAFLGLVVGIGYIAKGTSTVTHSARFLSTRSGLDVARETQIFTLLSPSTRSYEISLAPGNHGLPLNRLGPDDQRYYRYRNPDVGKADCEEGAAFKYRAVSVGQWQSWNLEARAVRGLEGGVHFEAGEDRLKITNLSPFAIERGLYLEHGRGALASPFGEVPAGKSVEVVLYRNRCRPLEDLGLSREAFAGRMLAPVLDPLEFARSQPIDPSIRRQTRALLCLLKEEAPTVTVNASVSGGSRRLTVLHVAEEEPR